MTTCARKNCSNELPPRKILYCSRKCYVLDKSRRYYETHSRTSPPRKCQRPECENTYQPNGGRRYCSDECAEIMKKRSQAGRDSRRPDRWKAGSAQAEQPEHPAPKPEKKTKAKVKPLAGTPDRSPDAIEQGKRQVEKVGAIRRWKDEEAVSLIDWAENKTRERIRPNYPKYVVK